MKRILLLLLLSATFIAAGVWYAQSRAPHRHELTRMTDAQGQVYYTCAMHPQVRQDEPGNCPICGMRLSRRTEPGAQPAERSVLYWYDPMKPEVHFDAPGKSPFMDMDLVPKYADAAGEAGTDDVLVRVSPDMVQRLGIRTAVLERGTFWQRVDAPGQIVADEHSLRQISLRAEGWVEVLHLRAEGEPVRRGQLLAEVYSPALDSARQELRLAQASGQPELIEGARAQLRALGLDASAVAGSTGRRIRLVSPMDGYVMRLLVREGQAVMPDQPLFELVSHNPLWVLAEIPEDQALWVGNDRPVEIRVPAQPGRVYEGRVDYLYPQLDTTTRTRRARIVLANPRDHLHPGMFAEVTLYGGPQREVLLAPSEALIRTGRRSVVIVDEGEGRYRPVTVTAGPERGGQTVLLDGVEEGQRVVVSGQFLIDSEASLLGAYRRLNETPATEPQP